MVLETLAKSLYHDVKFPFSAYSDWLSILLILVIIILTNYKRGEFGLERLKESTGWEATTIRKALGVLCVGLFCAVVPIDPYGYLFDDILKKYYTRNSGFFNEDVAKLLLAVLGATYIVIRPLATWIITNYVVFLLGAAYSYLYQFLPYWNDIYGGELARLLNMTSSTIYVPVFVTYWIFFTLTISLLLVTSGFFGQYLAKTKWAILYIFIMYPLVCLYYPFIFYRQTSVLMTGSLLFLFTVVCHDFRYGGDSHKSSAYFMPRELLLDFRRGQKTLFCLALPVIFTFPIAVVHNYFAKRLLEPIRVVSTRKTGDATLIDASGFYLKETEDGVEIPEFQLPRTDEELKEMGIEPNLLRHVYYTAFFDEERMALYSSDPYQDVWQETYELNRELFDAYKRGEGADFFSMPNGAASAFSKTFKENNRWLMGMLNFQAMAHIYEGNPGRALELMRINYHNAGLGRNTEEVPVAMGMVTLLFTNHIAICFLTSFRDDSDALRHLAEIFNETAKGIRTPLSSNLFDHEHSRFEKEFIQIHAERFPFYFDRLRMLKFRSWYDFDRLQIGTALERYRLANGEYPSSLDFLVPTYLDHIPRYPIDGSLYLYQREGDTYNLKASIEDRLTEEIKLYKIKTFPMPYRPKDENDTP